MQSLHELCKEHDYLQSKIILNARNEIIYAQTALFVLFNLKSF